MNPVDLPDTIPVFPLPGALLLPRTRLPLNIFEPRYLAMIEDCLKSSHRLIGMIQPRPSAGDDTRLQAIGCAGRLVGFSETEDGRFMITLRGLQRFRLLKVLDGFTAYLRCAVDWSDFHLDLGPEETDPDFPREAFLATLGRYFSKLNLSTDWTGLQGAGPELLVNSLSMLCPFSPEDKQALLEARTLAVRRESLAALIEFALYSDKEEETLQ